LGIQRLSPLAWHISTRGPLAFSSAQGSRGLIFGGCAAEAGAEKPRVPLDAYFAALFRYALIALMVYVIFKFLRVPLASMVVGMCALAAAAIAASVYELWHSER